VSKCERDTRGIHEKLCGLIKNDTPPTQQNVSATLPQRRIHFMHKVNIILDNLVGEGVLGLGFDTGCPAGFRKP